MFKRKASVTFLYIAQAGLVEKENTHTPAWASGGSVAVTLTLWSRDAHGEASESCHAVKMLAYSP